MSKFFDKFLIEDWRQAWKFYSMWFYLIVGLSPDIYNLLVAAGLFDGTDLPAMFDKGIKLIAAAGAIARLVKQAGAAQGLPTSLDDYMSDPKAK
ncbi:hypothetical protein LUCX_259 [Xanthomonas phage vB_XciM_LucasX]|nr:hypothetical protein LUCX_259 [Xanthomonas phage vB_XciM_LucasX]